MAISDFSGHKAVRGVLWASIDRLGSMIIQFGVNLILARLLLPKDFGIIGMLIIFIAVSQTILEGGFGRRQIISFVKSPAGSLPGN